MAKGNLLLNAAAEQLIDAVIALLLDATPQAHERIKHAAKKAGEAYLNTNKPFLVRIAAMFFRSREEEVKQTNIDLEQFPDVFIRFQTLAKVLLNPKGEWDSTSYNTYLLVYLLGGINEDKHPTRNKIYYDMRAVLAQLFKEKLQQTYNDLKLHQGGKVSKQGVNIPVKQEDNYDFILLADSHGQAQIQAKSEVDKAVFLLEKENQAYKLFAYDLEGERIELPTQSIQDDIHQALKDNKLLKKLCFKAKEAFILGTKFYINPRSADLSELKSAFAIRQSRFEADRTAQVKNAWITVNNIDWYDEKGDSHQVNLRDYPELEAFLANNPELTKAHELKLAFYLHQIDLTAIAVKQSQQALNRLFQPEQSATTSNEDPIASMKVVSKPENTELASFKSTFVIERTTNDKSQIVSNLYWCDKFGLAKKIDLADYPDIQQWLSEHPEWEDNDPDLKEILVKVDVSKAVNREQIKKKLVEVLESRQPKIYPTKKLDLSKFEAVSLLFKHRSEQKKLPAKEASESSKSTSPQIQ